MEVLCGLLQSFNTEVTAMLCALRVKGLIVTEYTEPLPGK